MLNVKSQLSKNRAPTFVSDKGPWGRTELWEKRMLNQARKQKVGFLLSLLESGTILPELSKLK